MPLVRPGGRKDIKEDRNTCAGSSGLQLNGMVGEREQAQDGSVWANCITEASFHEESVGSTVAAALSHTCNRPPLASTRLVRLGVYRYRF